jgi:hypothetical protein
MLLVLLLLEEKLNDLRLFIWKKVKWAVYKVPPIYKIHGRNIGMANDKSKEKINRLVKDEVTKMFEQVLDYAQVACPTADTYKVLRSKVLRVGNNCIRNIKRKIEQQYEIEYKAISEDIIEVSKKR